LVSILAFIVVVGVMVFFHEAGHLVAAKIAGIRVLRFSLGFGKVLFGFKWGGTDYVVSLIPLGGYVKMAGSEELDPGPAAEGEAAVPDGEPPKALSPSVRTGAPDEFLSKPPWVRMLVYAAGPLMNFVLAALLFAFVAKVGFTVQTSPNRVGGVIDKLELGGKETVSPARAAGFQPDDVVVAIDGKPTPLWYDLVQQTAPNAGKELTFEVRRAGKPVVIRAIPMLDPDTGGGLVGLWPYLDNRVSEIVVPKGAAPAAGIAKGDRLVALDGKPVDSFTAFLAEMNGAAKGRHIATFATAQGHKAVPFQYGGGGEADVLKNLGVACGTVAVKRSSSWGAMFPDGVRKTWDVASGIVKGIGMMIRGRVKLKNALGGPVTMAVAAGATARAGAITFIDFIGRISVMLAVLNLLPIPVFDGGQIMVNVVEAIRRRDLSVRARMIVAYVGLVIIGGIFLLALFGDANLIWRLLRREF
jgi:regulator of sigma E protease